MGNNPPEMWKALGKGILIVSRSCYINFIGTAQTECIIFGCECNPVILFLEHYVTISGWKIAVEMGKSV